MTAQTIDNLLAVGIFDAFLDLIDKARIVIIATLLVVGAGITVAVMAKTKTLGPTMGAGITTIVVVALVAMMPGLADSTVEQIGDSTGTGGDEVGDIFSRGNTP